MPDPEEILKKYARPVPRYTSYPTAPHFQQGLGEAILPETVAAATNGERISAYMHIPFCDRLCWFCACHTKQTQRYDPVAAYVGSLVNEIGLYRNRLSQKPALEHLHLGGGSPSLLKHEDFARIAETLEAAFAIDGKTEISIEIDPNDHGEDLLSGMKRLGVTRASIGVQDFDPVVQQVINRPQSFEQTRDLLLAVRSLGIESVNIDALYGLPMQTMERLENTIACVISLSPERVALFGYAHVPWMKKHQTLIREDDLPGPLERFRQAQRAEALLVEAGYVKIGIDHFARPDDSLARAAQAGTLGRNFQGYTTDRCETMIPLGASAIGRSPSGYLQNLVPTGQYRTSVDNDKLAVAKGYRFTADDLLRAHVIERLMCDFEFRFEQLAEQFGGLGQSLAEEARLIARNDEDGLCEAGDEAFRILPQARPFARIVASWFDAHMRESSFQYSRAV
ncbi:MAG: oxygen-independent coproporphyrinogen III oxidase [Nitratireductor sp.]|nr:oxygen-independent coproporphyrinogen III oxidase [Nitratireductor sp.]